MSNDFGINNSGGGFDFDDDSDLEQMLQLAAKGETTAEDEGDDGIFLEENGELSSHSTEPNVAPVQVQAPVAAAPAFETIEENFKNEEIPDKTHESSISVIEEEPEQLFEPVAAVEVVAEAKPFARNRPIIRKESEMVSDVSQVIKVLDVYRGLSAEVKNVVVQFVYSDNSADPSDEATLVVKVINADEMLGKTMTNLRESAEQTDRVERAFYILRLKDKELSSLGALVSTLTGEELNGHSDRIGFSKQIEASVDTLDSKIVQFVTATELVLNAAK